MPKNLLKKASKTRIFSLNSMCAEIITRKNSFSIVSIRDSEIYEDSNRKYKIIDENRENCESVLPIKFDDIIDEIEGHTTPQLHHVSEILQWSSDKGDIVVHCTAGVSRSSAVAYLIECSRGSPEEALKILDPVYHWPNMRIVELGSMILDDKKIFNIARRWEKRIKEKSYADSELQVF